MHVGLHTAALPEALSGARRRIILHLGLYNDFFALPGLAAALDNALEAPAFRNFQIITLPEQPAKGWLDFFLRHVRPGLEPGGIEHELSASRDAIVRLAARHPGQISIYETRLIPLTPMILADDRIFFSNFSHSSVSLFSGFWNSLSIDVGQLFTWAEEGTPPAQASPKALAAFRLVHEAAYAMRDGKRMLL